jgi:hypothetical protein
VSNSEMRFVVPKSLLADLTQHSETAVTNITATLLVYSTENAKWQAQGPGNGVSRIYLYKTETPRSYRIVSRNAQDKSVCRIFSLFLTALVNCNSILTKATTYNKATDVFHQVLPSAFFFLIFQWRDARGVYGINFPSKPDALSFGQLVDEAITDLSSMS